MNIKQLLVATAITVGCTLVGTNTANAVDPSQLRIYLNPGHGSWGPNDRPMKTIRQDVSGSLKIVDPKTSTAATSYPDTTAFYESNTNLQKVLEIFRQLQAMGLTFDPTKNQTNSQAHRVGAGLDMSNNIVFSHVKCGPYPNTSANDYTGGRLYNRNLSEIAEEVETGNFDMFVSVHSNAANTDADMRNAPLMLYRGPNNVSNATASDQPIMNKSVAMCNKVYPYFRQLTVNGWSSTAANTCGDWSFYGSHSVSSTTGADGHLGVLRHHVPGYLAEGYHHTYQPARHRALNFDVDHMEGYAYAMGIADYFGLTKPSTGNLYGIVRDRSTKLTHELYTPRSGSDDEYLPINGATVTLKKNGAVVGTYTTDMNYNGAYVFKNLAPGNYTIEANHPDFVSQTVTATVVAASTVCPETLWLEPSFGDFPVNYTAEYIDEPISEMNGYNIRRIIPCNIPSLVNEFYILGFDANENPKIIIYNAKTKSVKKTVDLTDATGAIRTVSDIALTSDGFLVGVNAANQPIFTLEQVNLKFYYWNNGSAGRANGKPQSLGTSMHSGRWNNGVVGKSFSYEGTINNGWVVYSSKSQASESIRLCWAPVTNKVITGDNYDAYNIGGTAFDADNTMGDYQMWPSPWNSRNLFVTSQNKLPMEVKLDYNTKAGTPTIVATCPDLFTAPAKGFRSSYFSYGGKKYMVSASDDDAMSVRIYDVSGGLASAKKVTTFGTNLGAIRSSSRRKVSEWTEAQKGVAHVAANVDVADPDNPVVHIFVVRGNGAVSHIVSQLPEVEEPDPDLLVAPNGPAHYAYYLHYSLNADGTYGLGFYSTGRCKRGRAILTNMDDAHDVREIEINDIEQGYNSVTVPLDMIPVNTNYKWAIELTSYPISNPAQHTSESMSAMSSTNRAPKRALAKANTNGGVVVMTDPEYLEEYGKTYVSYGYGGGIEVFNPDRSSAGKYLDGDPRLDSNNRGTLWRGTQRAGKPVFVAYSDATSGIWEFDPESKELTNILAGTNDGQGAQILNGVNLGGSFTGISFKGKGAAEEMYAFAEDWPTSNGGHKLVKYNTAGKSIIDMAPTQFNIKNPGATNPLGFENHIVEISTLDEGILVSQYRGPNNNTRSCPGFVFSDYSGNVLLNSADVPELVSADYGCGPAVAFSLDKTKFAAFDAKSMIHVFDVTWNGNKPTLSYNTGIPVSLESTDRGGMSQMRFDPAGNIATFTQGKGYELYAVPEYAPTAVSPAASYLVVNRSVVTGVEDVEIDNGVIPVEYYNLQGQRIDSPRAGQIVIRRQGKNVKKILFK